MAYQNSTEKHSQSSGFIFMCKYRKRKPCFSKMLHTWKFREYFLLYSGCVPINSHIGDAVLSSGWNLELVSDYSIE